MRALMNELRCSESSLEKADPSPIGAVASLQSASGKRKIARLTRGEVLGLQIRPSPCDRLIIIIPIVKSSVRFIIPCFHHDCSLCNAKNGHMVYHCREAIADSQYSSA